VRQGFASLTAIAPYGTRCIRRTSNRISSHSTTVPVMAKKGRPTPVCQSWGLLTIRLLRVSRLRGASASG